MGAYRDEQMFAQMDAADHAYRQANIGFDQERTALHGLIKLLADNPSLMLRSEDGRVYWYDDGIATRADEITEEYFGILRAAGFFPADSEFVEWN